MAEHTIDDLLSELGDVESDYEPLAERIWEHVPDLPECEKPIDDVKTAIDALRDYLTERKKELES